MTTEFVPTLHTLQLTRVLMEDVSCHTFEAAEKQRRGAVCPRSEVEAELLDEDRFVLRLRVALTGRNAPVRMRLTVLAFGTTLAPSLNGEPLREWAERSGGYLLWPYARGYISVLSVQLGLPELVLPLISIPAELTAGADPGEAKGNQAVGDPSASG